MTRIAIDPARPVGRLDRKVFGGFVEHLGRCIYGGLYEEGSPLSDDRGFRKDVLGLLRELRLGVLRWPGGNFVSNYHWADGIGPRDRRPRRPELAWGGEESNRFGTDEYLAYCAELGTEPYICLNMGTGTAATVGAPDASDGSVSANSVSAHNVAVTLVNRSPGEELAEVLLRDYTFAGSAQIRTVTAARPGDPRTLPDVETAQLEEGSENPKDGVVAIRLPPRSYTVIEATMTDR